MFHTNTLRPWLALGIIGAAALGLITACGADRGDFGGDFAGGFDDTNNDSNNDTGNNDQNNDGFGSNNDGPNNNSPNNEPEEPFIPEPEEVFNFLAPQPSRNYVFVANSDLDTVAKIDADTLEITSIEVGDNPTVVRTWKETNVAVVLNEGSSDVSIIHADPLRDDVVTLPIREGFNQIVMAPGGRHALAYLNYAAIEDGEEEIGRFQDVNLIRLVNGDEAVFNVAVGFRVLEIEFDDDGERAFVVTEDGISIIDMENVDDDINAQPVPVTDDPLEDALAVDREVEITGDGRLALVRSSVLEGLNVISLDGQGQLVQVTLDGIPTDLDIYPDSTSALAVVKNARQVVTLDLADVVEDPETVNVIDVPEGPLGLAALDVTSGTALLYSTATVEPRITRLDINTGDQTTWDIRKGLAGVHLSPDASRAVLFHVKGDAPRTDNESDVFIAQSWAYSVLDTRSGFVKLQTAPTEPGEFVFTDDSQTMFVILNDPANGVRQVDRINLQSFRVDPIVLGSPPEHIGILPSSDTPRVYVSQEHPVGRMTFITIEDGDAKTVTGYELNSRID